MCSFYMVKSSCLLRHYGPFGSISTQYEGEQLQFTLGAVCASFTFFFSLGYGARFLAPMFQNPKSWKVLEFLVGLTMLIIALTLVFV